MTNSHRLKIIERAAMQMMTRIRSGSVLIAEAYNFTEALHLLTCAPEDLIHDNQQRIEKDLGIRLYLSAEERAALVAASDL